MGTARPVPAAVGEQTFIEVAGGGFVIGDVAGEPDEATVTVFVKPFRLKQFEVTNRQFAAFVAATGHITDADWRHPHGSEDAQADNSDHPVVQVSARDAAAFCQWFGGRLPSGAEWEFAARGTDGRRYPWGNEAPQAVSRRRANFGTVRCCAADDADGYERTAPVGSFPSGVSPLGLFDMAGNVWEWTASLYPGRADWVALRGGGWGNDPYCLRVSYRHGNPPDIGLDMVGFRCAGDVE